MTLMKEKNISEELLYFSFSKHSSCVCFTTFTHKIFSQKVYHMKMIQEMKENILTPKMIFFSLNGQFKRYLRPWCFDVWNFNDDLDSGVNQMLQQEVVHINVSQSHSKVAVQTQLKFGCPVASLRTPVGGGWIRKPFTCCALSKLFVCACFLMPLFRFYPGLCCF